MSGFKYVSRHLDDGTYVKILVYYYFSLLQPISLPDVEQYALQFNYHDGHIDTEVCTEASDSQSSLNIKRAVASLFQTAVFQDSGSTSYHEVHVALVVSHISHFTIEHIA